MPARLIRTLAASILLGSLLPAYGAPPDLVTAVGDEFAKDGVAYRFVGMNLRGLAHYGGGAALPYTSGSHIDENLDGVANLGGRVVRVFAANKHVSITESVNRLGQLLDRADSYGLKLIIALTDFYPTSYHPPGDEMYYTMNPGGWTVLNHAWFAGGYQDNYLPWVTAVITAHKDHPAIFSWQIGNELADQSSAATHDAFVHAVAAHIKALDPHHMVSTGMLSLAHIPGYTVDRGVALYSDPNLDFITAHRYNDETHPIDFTVRDLVNKPLVISEAGCEAAHPAVNGDRVAFMNARMDYYLNTLQARGFMNWGYQAQGYDIGDGDGRFGIDRYSHPDYDAMVSLYASYAATLNAYNEPVIDEDALRGRNLAPAAVGLDADSVFGPGWGPDQAIDGDLATKWTSTNRSDTHWIAVDLGQPQIITGFRVKMAGAGGEWTCFNFAQFAVASGPSLAGPWTTLRQIDNAAKQSIIEIVLAEPIRAPAIRLWIFDAGLDDYARLPEFEIIGDPPPRADWDFDGDVDLADATGMQQQAADLPSAVRADLLNGCWGGPEEPLELHCY